MKYNDFIRHVQSFSQVDSLDEVRQAVHATLRTLADRIPAETANKLVRQLPVELRSAIQDQKEQAGSSFTLKEFYQRVSEKENIDPATAVIHVRSVFAVLNSAIIPADFSEIQAALSEDYEELFVAPIIS